MTEHADRDRRHRGLLRGCPSLDRLWSILLEGRDVTSEVPTGRWLIDPAEAFDRRVALADHVYTTRGGFVEGPRIDPLGSGSIRTVGTAGPVWFTSPCRRPARHGGTANRADRSPSHGRGLRQHRAAHRDGLRPLPRGSWACFRRRVAAGCRRGERGTGSHPYTHAESEPLNAFPAGLPAAMVAERWDWGAWPSRSTPPVHRRSSPSNWPSMSSGPDAPMP